MKLYLIFDAYVERKLFKSRMNVGKDIDLVYTFENKALYKAIFRLKTYMDLNLYYFYTFTNLSLKTD